MVRYPDHVSANRNTRIKDELNEDAHKARMETFNALYNECERLAVKLGMHDTDTDRTQAVRLSVLLTQSRAVLRHHVETMSQRVKLR